MFPSEAENAHAPRTRFKAAGAFRLPLLAKRGLELLGKQRKEFAGGEGPRRAERAGASESLGRGEEPD
jgi:hypothetical protein